MLLQNIILEEMVITDQCWLFLSWVCTEQNTRFEFLTSSPGIADFRSRFSAERKMRVLWGRKLVSFSPHPTLETNKVLLLATVFRLEREQWEANAWQLWLDSLVDCIVTDQFFFPLCIVWHLTTNNKWFVFTFFTQCRMSETKLEFRSGAEVLKVWWLKSTFGSRGTVTRCWLFSMPSHVSHSWLVNTDIVLCKAWGQVELWRDRIKRCLISVPICFVQSYNLSREVLSEWAVVNSQTFHVLLHSSRARMN